MNTQVVQNKSLTSARRRIKHDDRNKGIKTHVRACHWLLTQHRHRHQFTGLPADCVPARY